MITTIIRLILLWLVVCVAGTAVAPGLYAQTPGGSTAVPAANGAAPASSSASGSALPTAVSSTYELAPYDVIEVTVYQEADLNRTVRLGSDGTAILPLIGAVELGGKTVNQAIKAVQHRYASGYVRNPDVMINVLEYRKKSFSILGQVQKPGVYEIQEGSHLNIVEAILMGGGYTRIASQNGVTVKRMVDGKEVVLHVKAATMARNPDIVPFEVQPDDIIYVSESWF